MASRLRKARPRRADKKPPELTAFLFVLLLDFGAGEDFNSARLTAASAVHHNLRDARLLRGRKLYRE